MPSGIEAEVAVLAVLASGAQVVPINPFFTPPELRVVLAEADPSAIVTGPEAEAKLLGLEAERGDCLLAGFGTTSSRVAALDLDAWIADETLRLDPGAASDPDDVGLLIFTGGTTGAPKAVEHRHGSLLASLRQHCSVWPVSGSDRFLTSAPIFHVWGLLYAVFVPLYCGGSLVIVPRHDAERVLEAIERERITVFGGGPAPIYAGLASSPRYASTDFSSLRFSLTGGSPCPEALSRQWEAHTGAPLLEGWGMSEAAPLCLNRPDGPRKPDRVAGT
jgi:long-chain acyl-CoA synthetase